MKSRSLHLLIAEDDLDDRLLLEDAFQDNNINVDNTKFAGDGEELLKALNNSAALPDIILLDLNMPRKDGREALKEIKANKTLRHIPVIIFTTSNSIEDIKMAYLEGGSTFITKPARYADLVDTVGIMKRYWFEKAALAS